MPTYTIQPSDGSFCVTINASSAATVLNLVQRLECKEAEVLCDGCYAFSIRLGVNGLWCVFQRDQGERPEAAEALG
jgi:hypothetical protein